MRRHVLTADMHDDPVAIAACRGHNRRIRLMRSPAFDFS